MNTSQFSHHTLFHDVLTWHRQAQFRFTCSVHVQHVPQACVCISYANVTLATFVGKQLSAAAGVNEENDILHPAELSARAYGCF